MQVEKLNPLPFSPLERKCSTCGHLNVCTMHRAIGPLLANWEEDKPIDVDELAVICKEYVILAGVDQL